MWLGVEMTYSVGTVQWRISGDKEKARRELTGHALHWLHLAREAKHLGKFTWHDTGWKNFPQGNIRVISTPSVDTVYMDAVSGGEIKKKKYYATWILLAYYATRKNDDGTTTSGFIGASEDALEPIGEFFELGEQTPHESMVALVRKTENTDVPYTEWYTDLTPDPSCPCGPPEMNDGWPPWYGCDRGANWGYTTIDTLRYPDYMGGQVLFTYEGGMDSTYHRRLMHYQPCCHPPCFRVDDVIETLKNTQKGQLLTASSGYGGYTYKEGTFTPIDNRYVFQRVKKIDDVDTGYDGVGQVEWEITGWQLICWAFGQWDCYHDTHHFIYNYTSSNWLNICGVEIQIGEGYDNSTDYQYSMSCTSAQNVPLHCTPDPYRRDLYAHAKSKNMYPYSYHIEHKNFKEKKEDQITALLGNWWIYWYESIKVADATHSENTIFQDSGYEIGPTVFKYDDEYGLVTKKWEAEYTDKETWKINDDEKLFTNFELTYVRRSVLLPDGIYMTLKEAREQVALANS